MCIRDRHKDRAVICQVGDRHYKQLTVVGNIMTTVHRIESVAVEKSVCMLSAIPEATQLLRRTSFKTNIRKRRGEVLAPSWELYEIRETLKGVGDGEQRILIQEFVE